MSPPMSSIPAAKEAKAMTLKPEDRALIERVLGAGYSPHVGMAAITADELGLLIQAARSEGDVSREGSEPVAWLCHDLILGDSHVITDRQRAEWRAQRFDEWRVEPLVIAAPPPALPDEVVRLRREAFIQGYKEAWSGRGDHTEPRREYIAKLAEEAADRLPTTEGA